MRKLVKAAAGFIVLSFLFGCGSNDSVDVNDAAETAVLEDNGAVEESASQVVQNEYAENPNAIKIVINGAQLKTSSPPETKDGTTMVPFRDIFNALGVTNDEIVWNQAEKSVMVKHNGNTVFFIIDNVYAAADGKSVEMPVAAYINNKGVTMVPARFISESLRAKVRWEGETRTVKITT